MGDKFDLQPWVIEQVAGLTDKARHILAIIMRERDALTRDDLARRLGQPTLYGYDLRSLKDLEERLLIGCEVTTRYHYRMDHDPMFRAYVEDWDTWGVGSYKRMRWGNGGKVYLYWCNDNFRPILRKILR